MLVSVRVRRSATSEVAAALRPLALIGVATALLDTHADPDLWGHVRFGLDILNGVGAWTGSDPYSFTQDHPFLYHEWLGGVVMALAYRLAASTGLMVLKALLASMILALVWQVAGPLRFTWRWGVMAVAAWSTLPLTLTLRPQLWTGLGVFLVCRVLVARSSRALWALPPLFALWANLHGGWIVGAALLVVWTAAAWVQRQPTRWMLLLAGAVSLLATLLTPYHLDLWMFMLSTVRFGRDRITEWQPIWHNAGLPLLAWVLAAGLTLISLRRAGKPEAATLIAMIGLALASARVSRLAPLFALSAIALLPRQWPLQSSVPGDRDASRVVIDVVAVAVAVALAVGTGAFPPCIAAADSSSPDTAAAESLRGAHGRLVTSFGWGEYALWHFGPDLKVSIDGRRETVYSENTVREQLAIVDGTPDGLAALARLAPDYVWLPAFSATTAQWLRANGYREDIRTRRSFIAVRSDLMPLTPWAGRASGCFPGP
jgi:hypothetical protein